MTQLDKCLNEHGHAEILSFLQYLAKGVRSFLVQHT